MKLKGALLLFLVTIFTTRGFAQQDLLQEELDRLMETHPIRVGLLRIQPQLLIGSGYDSNVLSASDNRLPVEDYLLTLAPTGDFAVKLGHRGYFAVEEALNFVYYKDMQELRDTYNTTGARLVTGNRRILLAARGGYISKKAPANYESDEPVLQRFTQGGISLLFAMRRHTDLTFHYDMRKHDYEELGGFVYSIPPTPDSWETAYSGGIQQEILENIRLIVEWTTGRIEFLNTEENLKYVSESAYWNVLAGLDFRSRHILGSAKAGISDREPTVIDGKNFRDFIVDTDFDYLFRRRLSLGALFQRRRSTSALLQQNGFVLYTQVGGRAEAPLGRRFFIDGTVLVGSNDYDGDAIIKGEAVTQDDYRQYDAGLNFDIGGNMVLRFGTKYQDRRSNVDELRKNRATFNVGISWSPEEYPRFPTGRID